MIMGLNFVAIVHVPSTAPHLLEGRQQLVSKWCKPVFFTSEISTHIRFLFVGSITYAPKI
jgi:hypothetical protein